MAVTKVIEIKADTGDAEKDIKNLGKTIDKTSDKAEKSTKELGSATKNTSKDVKGLGSSFRGLGTAIKATGIGLLIGLVAKLTQAFTRNKQIMDTVNGVLNGINIIFSEVSKGIIDAFKSVDKLTGGFESTKKVIKGLMNIALVPLKLLFNVIKAQILTLQLAWEKSFFGDGDPETIKRLKDEIKDTGKAIVQIGKEAIASGAEVVNNFKTAVSEISELASEAVENISKIDVKASIEQGKQLERIRNNALIAQAEIQGLIEKYDRLAEEQRQIRDDETLSINERIDANNKLGELLDEQLKQQKALAEQVVASAQAEISAGDNRIENLVALKEAQNELAGIEAQVAGFRSEQLINQNSLEKERLENLRELQELGLTEQEQKELEIIQEFERQQLLIEKTAENEEQLTELLVLAKQDRDARLLEVKEDGDEKRLKSEQKTLEQEKTIEENRRKERQKTLDNFISIFGAESKIGKAALIAKQLLNAKELLLEAKKTLTFSSLAVARSTVAVAEGTAQTAKIGFPQNIPLLVSYGAQAVGIISAIASAVGKTKSVASGLGGSGGGGGASAPSAPALSPQFNLVGQDSNNILAQTIQGQTQQPVKAFVVSNEITDAQSLDNNIIGNASIG